MRESKNRSKWWSRVLNELHPTSSTLINKKGKEYNMWDKAWANFGLILIAIIIALSMISTVARHNIDEYNKNVCAVTGYQEDCKTPLEGR